MSIYSSFITMATSLLKRYGRSISLLELNNTTPSGQPWKPSGESTPLEQRENPVESITIDAVFLPAEETNKYFGRLFENPDLVKRGVQTVMVSTNRNVENFDELKDSDGSYWKIERVSSFRPQQDYVLHIMELSR